MASPEGQADDRLQRIYDREGRNTSSSDPKMMNSRVFIGNLAAEKVSRQAVEKMFGAYGKILGVSLHKSYGFVQFDNEETAREAVKAINGTTLHGLKLDVNIATERRKDGPGPPPPGRPRKYRSPSPPPGRLRDRGRFEYERFRHWERDRERFGRRSPPFPPPPPHMRGDPYYGDRFYDRYPPPRDPYARPRDDPYDRHPRERYPPRDYDYDYPPHPPTPAWDYPPPQRDRAPPYEYERPERPDYPPARTGDPYERRLQVERKEGDKLIDMEVIVVNRQQRDYAEHVCGRIEAIGLQVETVHLSPTVSLADALDDAAQRGLLYAMIITTQHEIHHSVTLTILHGRNPQEHKNMPLEDAIGLVDRDFDRYCQGVREGRIPPRRPEPSKQQVGQLLSKAASGEQLSHDQLQSVISALQKQQQSSAANPPPIRQSEPEPMHQPSSADDIQRQQADLQAKILSLLGSSAVVPSSSSAPQNNQPSSYEGGTSRPVGYPSGGGGGGGGGGYGGGGGGYSDAYGYGGGYR